MPFQSLLYGKQTVNKGLTIYILVKLFFLGLSKSYPDVKAKNSTKTPSLFADPSNEGYSAISIDINKSTFKWGEKTCFVIPTDSL